MEFFVILFAIIGFALVNEFGKRANDSSAEEDSDTPTVRDVDVSDDFEKARDFVRQRKLEKNAPQKNVREVRKAPIQPQKVKKSFVHKNKNVGKNYVDSIARLRRETERLQAQACEIAKEANVIKHPSATEFTSEQSSKEPFFADTGDLRRAFVVSEILSTPISLRK